MMALKGRDMYRVPHLDRKTTAQPSDEFLLDFLKVVTAIVYLATVANC